MAHSAQREQQRQRMQVVNARVRSYYLSIMESTLPPSLTKSVHVTEAGDNSDETIDGAETRGEGSEGRDNDH
jgi:hypothetical protein